MLVYCAVHVTSDYPRCTAFRTALSSYDPACRKRSWRTLRRTGGGVSSHQGSVTGSCIRTFTDSVGGAGLARRSFNHFHLHLTRSPPSLPLESPATLARWCSSSDDSATSSASSVSSSVSSESSESGIVTLSGVSPNGTSESGANFGGNAGVS
eukprot:6078614-Pyramimonas_sp.AAC.1